MNTYEYELIRMDPVSTNIDTVQDILNDNGNRGYRFITVQKFWTHNDYGQSIQRNFIILEKKKKEL